LHKNNTKPLVDSVQFFNSTTSTSLAKCSSQFKTPYAIALIIRRLYTAQKMLVLVICCTKEISSTHRLQKIRGNIAYH